ncbi:MAG TPA: glucoamylase family protein [Pyrinomonadaceae bacterium]|nr:glucoamylase family protein [Pyrinomonadaceae bacterium]
MAELSARFFGRLKRAPLDGDEEPIREELYSVERLELYAAALASEHRVAAGPRRGQPLLPRLEENGRRLIDAYRELAEAIRNERTISPAAEWLVDNFHIVEEQLREIREDLPKSYYYELPKLVEGELAGYARIYAVALALIAHTDSRLDTETLRRFIRAYQRVAPLSIGELWAIAITLRLALVENLRRLATRIVASRKEREEADALADKLLEMAARQPEGLVPFLNERWGKRDRMSRAFVVQLTLRLRDQDPAVGVVFDWLERQLAGQDANIEQIVHLEHQRQAAAQVTVGNIITSMRLISTLDWRNFFESVSLVDPALGYDPAGVYARMDFATRDHYRHVIERISKRTRLSELEVARRAVQLAEQSQQDHPADGSRLHVGYYLISDGLAELEEACAYRPSAGERLGRLALRHPTFLYLGTLALLTCLVIALLLFHAFRSGAGLLSLVGLALLALIPASDLALSMLNWNLTTIIKPRTLPKIDTSAGTPEEAQTMVVIPALLTSEAAVQELIEKLEVHYLANQDERLYFALLGDYVDATREETAEDGAILEAALRGIEELNARYGDDQGARFHLFHRRRQWNAVEGKWIGWERKRGKLHEFNRLLRGAARETSFIVCTAETALLSQIRYVITLDSDTQLPRDAARRLIGVISHPLNSPRFDPNLKRVTRGYAILQPRVSISLESASRTRFARIFSGNTGIDPYTTAVSDVYQDLFGEGIYTGKGLYVVDAFEAALDSRVPENSLLSHDLFECLFARAALVTDIELLDDYPAHYDTYAKRQHRWTRGDWQIARWLFPHVPDSHARKVRNTLPLISRWKILDNLRRSLVAPAMVLWLIAAWTLLPGSPLLWTLFALLVLAFPVYAHVTTSLLLHPRGIPWTSHFWSIWGGALTNTAQVALTTTFLAHQAYLMADAIIRTLYRKLISHKHLLEWVTAAHAERGSLHDRTAFLRFMWPAELIAGAAATLILLFRADALLVAAPFLLAWLASPLVAHWVSRRMPAERPPLTTKDIREARLIARRTWRFFETFVGVEDQWLPPDNYQEDPRPVIAHRTSPTNIGLLLLSTVAAHDFGYVCTLELTERLELTFSTLEKMQRFRGHFFNWYDTRTLEPLEPQYVSTVDSGNLAGHLIAAKQALVEIPERPLFDLRVISGLADTIAIINDEVVRLGTIRQRTQVVTNKQLRQEVDACANLVSAGPPETLDAWAALFESLAQHAEVIDDIIGALSQEHGAEDYQDMRDWLGALRHETRAYLRDLQTLAPWRGSLIKRLAQIMEHCPGEVAAQWHVIEKALADVPSLSKLPEKCDAALVRIAALRMEIEQGLPQGAADRTAALDGLSRLTESIEEASGAANALLGRMSRLAQLCNRYAEEMDFSFLMDGERKVFAIGYTVAEGRPDNSFYDLLASEARLASFIAIAKGDVPQEHWFRLGRALTPVNGSRALVSWTATMFEYLMPLLVMRDYDDTLLDQTYEAVVARQVDYGFERGVPWGVSESAYNARDLQLNYQYGPFGVPGLGLKRGLSEDLVVTPYATMLAAIVEPRTALENLRRLEREGALARYGFYEAIDYTPERLPQNQKRAIIRAFMAHHQGMILLALDNVLNADIMQKRFHADPLIQATELLLQERIPQGVPASHPRAEEVLTGRLVHTLTPLATRRYDSPDLPTPRTQLLSNGTYSLMLTTSGAGYSTCGPIAVTRWREDVVRDDWGSFCYLRDVRTGEMWSAGYQPMGRTPTAYEVAFSEDKAEFWRRDAGIVTHMEIIVSPEDNAEVRRVTLKNYSSRVREIEVTSYAEVVLATPASDRAHPAFSNLFIKTEFFAAESALLATRRQRSEKDQPVWGVHTIVTEGETVGAVQYETDRGRFLGRGHTTANPVAIIEDRPLSNTVGAVLDPIFSLRQRVRLQPQATAHITFATAVANSREEALVLADKYHDVNIFDRASKLAWTQSQVEMRHHNVNAEEAHLFQRLAGRVLFLDPSLRPRPHVLELNTKTQAGLWPYGISGDLPVVVVRISESQDLQMVRQILRGHEYLRLKGLAIDLVILNNHPPSYAQTLQDELQALIRTSGSQALLDKPGGVFLRRTDVMPEADRILLHAVARVVLVTDRGPLEDQIVRRPVESEMPSPFIARWPSRIYPEPVVSTPELAFHNGLGGFGQGGREYVTVLGEGQWTPAPWLNVIANPQDFGFQVTETGAGYTWSVNSRENRLTSWSNDAVSDPPSEIIYLRDEDTGTMWTPTPLPVREATAYVIRHGQGYTVFEHTSHGISQELLMFVPVDAPVKISLLRLRNRTERRRRLSVTSYQELVLGVSREHSAPFLITEVDETTGAIFARNPYNNEFADRVAFVATSERERTLTCDRKEFVGRNGTLARPAALRRTHLSGHTGAGLDPCAAMQTLIELAPHQTHEIILLLGEGQNAEEARAVVSRYRQVAAVNEAFEKAIGYWDELLGAVEVKTPDLAMDTLLNRWLLYQTLACRVWARSAFYQSGGAYGFRDQLQDVMALVYARPDIAREQVLRAAAHQFKEGDVQHWWHPPTDRGVRTRSSDDLLWLPYVTNFYVNATGDVSVLDEVVPFLEAPPLEEGQDESYTQPTVSKEAASLYEHCARALDRSLAVGEHGLPLMGSGDWNDGMNRVGNQGKGESVWVGWFLYTALDDFSPFCEARGETKRAQGYREHTKKLKRALEEHAWDGDWYRRAYFDDGTPLGSAQNEECRIDSIAQSWGLISGAADPHRAIRAMSAVEEYLIRRGDGLVILFTPPFDTSPLDPGYIKGYVPGVRENGGQYTHAALWTLIAYAALGDGDRAGELFTLLNPINHASTRAGLHKYKVEPYVAAADVYAVPPHTGRGGWTWYTGSAGWMYRAGLESILGFMLQGESLRLEPCIPRSWREYEINYRYGSTLYQIRVENPHGLSRGVAEVELDDRQLSTNRIPLINDKRPHRVRIVLGDKPLAVDERDMEAAQRQTAN